MKLNEKLEEIRKEFNENINSHIFLVETNDSEKCLVEIKKLIAELIDKNSDVIASQIKNESYIELTVIRPDGKFIKKEQVFTLQERIKTKPILSDKLFYIIMDADTMNDASSNKLLKTIEEPNDDIIGFLITENIDIMLPTIKSRCEIINVKFDKETKEVNATFENVNNIVKELILFIEKDNLLEFNIVKNDQKLIKENGKLIVNLIKGYYNASLNLDKNFNYSEDTIKLIKECNSFKVLINKTKYLNKMLNKLTFNMNIDLLLEKIFLELREVKRNASSRN